MSRKHDSKVFTLNKDETVKLHFSGGEKLNCKVISPYKHKPSNEILFATKEYDSVLSVKAEGEEHHVAILRGDDFETFGFVDKVDSINKYGFPDNKRDSTEKF